MKILITLVRWKGGVGRVVNSIKPLLEKEGYEVEVISREDDLKCFSLKDSIFKLREEIKKRDYDILYSQDWSCALSGLGLKNHYVCFHGEERSKVSKSIQSIVGRLFGRNLIVVGMRLKQRFPKSNLIYNGFSPKDFFELNKERNKIGWIKRDYEEITKEEFLEIAKRKNLEPTIAKDIPPEKMNEWYNSLKVFVSYPPKYAGFNLCWLEAKASGVPKVLGNENGIGISFIESNWKELTWENHTNKLLVVFQ